MTTYDYARKVRFIGQTEAALAVAIAIALDLSIFFSMGGSHGNDVYILLLLDGLAFFAFGQVFGIIAARRIILQKASAQTVGILCAWITLFCTTFAHPVFQALFYDEPWHIIGALSLCLFVFVLSFIPSGLHGLCFGWRIQKRGKNL